MSGNRCLSDLDFDSTGEAEAFLEKLRDVWQMPQAKALIDGGTPQVEIIETVESRTL